MIVAYCLIAILFWLALHACLRNVLWWIDSVVVRYEYSTRKRLGLQVCTTSGMLLMGGLVQFAMNVIYTMHMVF